MLYLPTISPGSNERLGGRSEVRKKSAIICQHFYGVEIRLVTPLILVAATQSRYNFARFLLSLHAGRDNQWQLNHPGRS